MDFLLVTITTKRLKLTPLSEDFAKDINREFSDEITTYMFPKSHKDMEETYEYITSTRRKIKRGEDLTACITDKKTGEFLGCAGAHHLKTESPSLGIWIQKSAQGNSYGREAVTALKNWLDKHINYEYITYPVDKRNVPSRKIAESLGGIIEDTYTKKNNSGNILDVVEYRIHKV